MPPDFLQLLGKPPESAQVRTFVSKLGERGEATEPDPELENRYYISFPKSGITLIVHGEENEIADVMIHLTEKEGDIYEGELPFELSARDSQQASRTRFGTPSKQGGPVADILHGGDVYWDLWEFDTHKLHLEYSGDRLHINQVTLSRS